jgi:pimeloyl-ACP methyl ester carboxylesterase
MRRCTALLAALLIPFAAILLLMISMQTQLLFPTNAVAPAGPLPATAQRMRVATADGEMLHGVHLAPDGEVAGPRLLVIGFGGNAWNAQDAAEYLHATFPEAHVVAFHYRGYRPSTGSPSAHALLADAPLIFDEAAKRIAPQKVVAVGFSIGSGVAASLAGRADGLILVTPFDSLKSVAQDLYPWLPVGPFFEHELDTASYLDNSETPVAIVAADRDEIIAPARTEALRKRVPRLVFDRTIAASGHNDIYQRQEFQAAMRGALVAVAQD